MRGNFYRRVMSIPLQRNRTQLPAQKRKKPMGGGGGGWKAKGIEAAADTEDLDVFKVVLSRDAGTESAPQQFFEIHLKNLSESQLRGLNKKIAKIRKRYLSQETAEEKNRASAEWIMGIIDHKLIESDLYKAELCNAIKQHFKDFEDLKIVRNSKGSHVVIWKNKQEKLRSFVEKHFSEHVESYRELVKDGKIIPKRRNGSGIGFVSRCLLS
ncbi:MAG: hypothetical protein Tsb0021_12340 [Chlamydiales bacterium]